MSHLLTFLFFSAGFSLSACSLSSNKHCLIVVINNQILRKKHTHTHKMGVCSESVQLSEWEGQERDEDERSRDKCSQFICCRSVSNVAYSRQQAAWKLINAAASQEHRESCFSQYANNYGGNLKQIKFTYIYYRIRVVSKHAITEALWCKYG